MPFWRKSDSTFERLRNAESRLPIPKKGQFPDVQALTEALKKRAALGQEFTRAFEAGQITEEEHKMLTRLNRLHMLGLTQETDDFKQRFPE
jgi:hypothetical protein